MPCSINSIARPLWGIAFVAAACGLTACGGGDEAAPTFAGNATTVASAEAGVVAADQLPSVMSTVAGLPSDQDLGQTQSL